MKVQTAAAALMVALVMTIQVSGADGEPDLAKLRYPLSKAESPRTPTFVLDVSEIPDDAAAQKWGQDAKELCEEWFPVLCKFLSTEEWTPPETVRLIVKKELDAPGVTSGAVISFSHKWITGHPDDFGMVVHELIHVIQSYPSSRRNPGWLVEGIADYLRYWKYESEVPHRPVSAKASYRDGYGTTGAFLAWITWKYDRRVVRRLDAALRKNQYSDTIFKDTTGKELSELWSEYVADQQRRTPKAAEN